MPSAISHTPAYARLASTDEQSPLFPGYFEPNSAHTTLNSRSGMEKAVVVPLSARSSMTVVANREEFKVEKSASMVEGDSAPDEQ
jgi:hypothetical protein